MNAEQGSIRAGGEPILEVRDLVKHYPLTQGILFKKQVGAVKAVDGVSFRLAAGETLGIVGESGCGKSTVARMLVHLEQPTAGSIEYKGEDITKLSGRALKAVRRNIQMVFQDPYTSLNPRMTVGDIIGEPYEIHPEVAPKGDRRRKVQDLLDVVGLLCSSSPAVSASASASPAASRSTRRSSSPTNRSPRSTSPCRPRSSTCSTGCRRSSS
ncbi:ABC transporter [Streptomyces sp. 136MFCol5.1]|nr:ABC transporter [Streptomyces sp. 136MFCol5.1]